MHAALTVTFGGLKPVHALADCGRVTLVDIGLDLPDADVLGFEAADVKARWPAPARRRQIHPRRHGHHRGLVDLSGCRRAVRRRRGRGHLGHGSLRGQRADRGAVALAGSRRRAHPAATGRVQSWVVGPGLGTDDTAAAALWFALDTDLPVIVDGDGLTLLAAHPDLVARREAPTVLTPHAREFARLAGHHRVRTASAQPANWPKASGPRCCSRATSPSSPTRMVPSTSIRPANRGLLPPAPGMCSRE
ncbi:carbohydrate kinase family protein [Mycobacterium xenopi 3993]|nr:carbohydrate kinase family protein [Mycobacterium xenopi 3993]